MKTRIRSLILAMLLVLSMATSTLAAGAGSAADIRLLADCESDTITLNVDLTAKNATNGRIKIDYKVSADYVRLVDVITYGGCITDINSDVMGEVYFAWVGSELSSVTEMLTLVFQVVSEENTNVFFKGTVTELYANGEDMLAGDEITSVAVVAINNVEQPEDPTPDVPVLPDPGPSIPVNPTPGPTPGPGGNDEETEEPEITIDPDGTVTETVTNKDGSTTTTVETADGTTSTTVTDKNGNVVEAAAEISKDVKDGETVTIPVEVPAASSSDEAVSVEITVPATIETVTVEIPVVDVTPGTVIVLVHEDGTEEIVNSTALTENGLAIAVDGSVTVKVVDNTKEFNDTGDHWAENAVTFVTAREIFNGTGNEEFTPEGQMTRAMMMTVLARLGGHDTSVENGEDWAAPGIEWAIANGISDGSRADENITREELATMLYLFAGAPETSGDLGDFTDADSVSDVSEAAMKWAVENGIINGMGDGTLNPQGEATRAQLAKILMYFINL